MNVRAFYGVRSDGTAAFWGYDPGTVATNLPPAEGYVDVAAYAGEAASRSPFVCVIREVDLGLTCAGSVAR